MRGLDKNFGPRCGGLDNVLALEGMIKCKREGIRPTRMRNLHLPYG